MSDLHYGLTAPEPLREAVGPLAACSLSGETVRTTGVLAEVTCEGCRNAVKSGAVAMWDIDAEEIEKSYLRQVRVLRRKLAFNISKVLLVGVVAMAALAWLLVIIWQEAST
ncbi:hypothetical protein [Nonomuraea sp. NPDC023979]|uniref:hypothetical protein n=1 Tax=Nonomuraea sp. NPDC023979 TaxID=3154796 RepID=UPI0033CB75F9